MEAVPLTLPHLPARDSSSLGTKGPGTIQSRPQRLSVRRDPLALRPLALWHLASMDAPTVAVVWAFGFAWAAGVRLAAWVPLLLALTVWAVYVFDRLLDARAAMRAVELGRLRERHYFHWRHRRVLLPLAAAAACAATGLILAFMPMAARERGSVLAAASLAYFARVHSGRRARPFLSALLTKELLVGVLFTVGCALPVFGALRAAHAALWPLACAAAFFAPLAWLNCHAIDRWESDATATRNKPRARSSFVAACVLAVLGTLLALAVSFFFPRAGALLASGAVSALLLAVLDQRREKLGAVALRAAADFVLLAPAPLLALAWLAR
jgi:hypothetical protein